MQLTLYLLALGLVFYTTPSLAAPSRAVLCDLLANIAPSGAVLCYVLANNATAPINTP
jgi:hypothetical protein